MHKVDFRIVKTFLVIFLLLSSAWTEKSVDSPNVTEHAYKSTIPLPGQSFWTESGILGGISMGSFSKSGCNSHVIWEGAGHYFYTPQISGGGGFRISGGNLDNSQLGAFTRYFLNTRFHFTDERTDIFFGPVVGLDNSNFTALKKEYRTVRDGPATASSGHCAEVFALNGMGLGYEFGAGWKMNRWSSLLLSHSYEYSFQGRASFDLSGGFAFDILRTWGRFYGNLSAVFLYLEYKLGMNLDDLADLDQTAYLGASVGY